MKMETIDNIKLPGFGGSQPLSVAEMTERMKKTEPAPKPSPKRKRAEGKFLKLCDVKDRMRCILIDWPRMPLGLFHDEHLGPCLGVSSTTVGTRRKETGMDPFTFQRYAEHPEWFDLALGRVPDTFIATWYKTSELSVRNRRKVLGIHKFEANSIFNPAMLEKYRIIIPPLKHPPRVIEAESVPLPTSDVLLTEGPDSEDSEEDIVALKARVKKAEKDVEFLYACINSLEHSCVELARKGGAYEYEALSRNRQRNTEKEGFVKMVARTLISECGLTLDPSVYQLIQN